MAIRWPDKERKGGEMKWVSVSEMMPTQNGIYKVKILVGSMNPKEQEMDAIFRIYPSGPRFLVGDWVKVTHWRRA